MALFVFALLFALAGRAGGNAGGDEVGPEQFSSNWADLSAEMVAASPPSHCRRGGEAPESGSQIDAGSVQEVWNRVGRSAYRKFYQAVVGGKNQDCGVLPSARSPHSRRRRLGSPGWNATGPPFGERELRGQPAAGLEKVPPALLLLTFPNSGTTWTRRVFERVTGVSSETIYMEGRGGMKGIPEHHATSWGTYVAEHGLVADAKVSVRSPDQTAFIKAHQPSGPLSRFHPKKVVRLIREPMEQAFSNAKYRHAQHPVNAVVIYLEEYVRWHCTVTSLQKLHDLRILSVTYDALLQDPESSFQRIIGWINGYGVPSDVTMKKVVASEPPGYTPKWFALDREEHGPTDKISAQTRPESKLRGMKESPASPSATASTTSSSFSPSLWSWFSGHGRGLASGDRNAGTSRGGWREALGSAEALPSQLTRSFECGFSNETLSFFFEYLSHLTDEYCAAPPKNPRSLGELDLDNARCPLVVTDTEKAIYF